MTENRSELGRLVATDYRSLIGERGWRRLHPDIQRRFSLRNAHRSVTYRGFMSEIYLSPAGLLLAQLCRLIGTPLALYPGNDLPMLVEVYPDFKFGGMKWKRNYLYPGRNHKPVVSTKCIRPNAGLVEIVGSGFGMYLSVYEKDQALLFESKGYFWQSGNFVCEIPALLTPGKTIVTQRALSDGKFEFSLDVMHPLLGQVYRQVGVFEEMDNAILMSP